MHSERLDAVLFGSPRLTYAGDSVTIPSRKGLALVLYLAAEARAVPRPELAALLWGDEGRDNLRQELSKLRRLPGADRWLSAGAAISVAAHTDLAAFERAVGAREDARALGLAHGGLLDGLDTSIAPGFRDWTEAQRSRLDRLYVMALKGRAESLAAEGRMAEALEHLRDSIDRDPLDESAHRAVMRLEYARGNLPAALEQYETIRRSLREELGIAPLAATQELATVIQHGDAAVAGIAPASRIPPRLMRPIALVGREREWARLERAWRANRAVILTGPPGIGKTRLMLDFVRSRGRYLLNEGHATDAAFPLSTLARGLRRARRTLPDLSLEPWVRRVLARLDPDSLPDQVEDTVADTDRQRLEDAWYEFMNELRPSVDALAADDVHWFDRASAHIAESVNVRLARQDTPSWRHLATLRPEEVDAGVLDRIEAGAEAGINEVIELTPFDVSGVADLLASLEIPGGPDLAEELHTYAGGNPMFVLETLRALYSAGGLEPPATRVGVPDRVAAAMARRLDALDPASLRILRGIAVLHPDATPERLAAMFSEPALAVAEAMGELERRQWLSSGAFLHDLGYEAVVHHMPIAVATYLHRCAAAALDASGADASRVAHHLEAGGSAERAREKWLEAAHAQLAQGLVDEAADAFRRVVEHGGDTAAAVDARHALERIASSPAVREPDRSGTT